MKIKKSRYYQLSKDLSLSGKSSIQTNTNKIKAVRKSIHPHYKNGNGFCEFFRRIWKSMQFMRWLAIISTILTILLGSFDVLNLISFKISTIKIAKLQDEIDNVLNISNDQLLQCDKNIDKFKEDKRFQDEYNFLKGCAVMDMKAKGIKRMDNENITPDFYFKRVSVTSDKYEKSIICRYASYWGINDINVRRKKIEKLIEELEDIAYFHPVYYMLKAYVICLSGSGDAIFESYKEFTTAYPYISEYPYINININETENSIIKETPKKGILISLDANTICELRAIDFFYMIFIYTHLYDSKQKEMAKTKLEDIFNSGDDEFIFIKTGFDYLMTIYPLFEFENYKLSKDSLPDYINHQKRILKMLLSERYKNE